MRVSSPIGDLPFEPRSLSVRDGGLLVEGVMGVWPAQVQVGLSDAPAVLRMIAKPAAVVLLTALVVGVAVRSRPRH